MIPMPPRPTAGSPQASYEQAIWDAVDSLRRAVSTGRRISTTTRGVIHHADISQGSGETSRLQFRGQWSESEHYDEGDIVIRALDSEAVNGNAIGTYIANQEIDSGAETAAGEVPSFPLHALSKWDLFSIVPAHRWVMQAIDPLDERKQIIDFRSGDPTGIDSARIMLDYDRNAAIDIGPKWIADLDNCGSDVIQTRIIRLCEVDPATGIKTLGWRRMDCGPFHAGEPPIE